MRQLAVVVGERRKGTRNKNCANDDTAAEEEEEAEAAAG